MAKTQIYISILRGINVGKQQIKMEALRKMYEGLGFSNVQTYIQSGNVLFQTAPSGQKDLEAKISAQVNKEFGFDVPVIVLNRDELNEIILHNPYSGDASKNPAYLHVTFLAAKPEKFDLEAIHLKKLTGEELTIRDKAVYLYCPNGYGVSKLSNSFFEKKLSVRATTRNWKTSNILLQMATP